MTNDEMVDAFNLAYSATWEASSPITTQGEATSVDRKAVLAGIQAALADASAEWAWKCDPHCEGHPASSDEHARLMVTKGAGRSVLRRWAGPWQPVTDQTP